MYLVMADLLERSEVSQARYASGRTVSKEKEGVFELG
jgi:hypothetical protein